MKTKPIHKTISHEILHELFSFDGQNLVWEKPTARRVQAGDVAGSIDTDGMLRVGLYGKRYPHADLVQIYKSHPAPTHPARPYGNRPRAASAAQTRLQRDVAHWDVTQALIKSVRRDYVAQLKQKLYMLDRSYRDGRWEARRLNAEACRAQVEYLRRSRSLITDASPKTTTP